MTLSSWVALTINTTDVSLLCTPSDTLTGSTCLGLVSLSMGRRTRTLPVNASSNSGESSSSWPPAFTIEYVSVESKSRSVAFSVATSEPIGISSEILYSTGALGHIGRLSFLSKIFTFTFGKKKKNNTVTDESSLIVRALKVIETKNKRRNQRPRTVARLGLKNSNKKKN